MPQSHIALNVSSNMMYFLQVNKYMILPDTPGFPFLTEAELLIRCETSYIYGPFQYVVTDLSLNPDKPDTTFRTGHSARPWRKYIGHDSFSSGYTLIHSNSPRGEAGPTTGMIDYPDIN